MAAASTLADSNQKQQKRLLSIKKSKKKDIIDLPDMHGKNKIPISKIAPSLPYANESTNQTKSFDKHKANPPAREINKNALDELIPHNSAGNRHKVLGNHPDTYLHTPNKSPR